MLREASPARVVGIQKCFAEVPRAKAVVQNSLDSTPMYHFGVELLDLEGEYTILGRDTILQVSEVEYGPKSPEAAGHGYQYPCERD